MDHTAHGKFNAGSQAEQKRLSQRETPLENWPIQTCWCRAAEIKKSAQDIFCYSVF